MPLIPIPEVSTTTSAAIYVRMASNHGAAELVLSPEIHSLKTRAAAMGCPDPVVIMETRTWGVSPAALQALTSFDIVLTQSPNRFSRDGVHMSLVADAMRAANVRVDMTDGGEQMMPSAQVMPCSASAEAVALVERLRRGRELAKARRAAASG